MIKYEKQQFVLDYIKNISTCGVNVLDQQFVDSYIERFKPKHEICMYGANICSDLGRLLSNMYKCNILERCVVSLHGYGMGFPKWVYRYWIK